MWNAILQKAKGTISTGIEFIEDKVDTVSNEIEYGFNQARQGNYMPAAKAIQKATSPAFAPLIDATYKVADAEESILQVTGDSVERLTGIPSQVTQIAAGVLVPGPGEYKAAAKSVTKGVKKAFPLDGLKAIDRGGPPGPALAPAGANLPQLKPDFNGAYVNLTPQVMEAKRYLSQDDFDIKQPQRIRDARDLVDESGIKIQNIEEANTGVTTKELSIKNPEYKAAKKVFKHKTAQVSSEESNILTPGPGREYAYPPTRPRAKEMKRASLEVRKTIEDLELHHKLPKGISAAFFNRARDFMEDGLMTLDEFKDMAVRAQKRGMEPGDIEQNMLPQSKVPHNRFHTEMRAQPSNQFPGENLEISKTKLTQRLRKVKNKKELNKLWNQFLDDDGRYLYDTAEIWEPMDNTIKSVSPKYTGTAKSKKK